MSDTSTKYSFDFGSKKISYELTYADRKTLGIRVYPDCRVKVIAPGGISDDLLVKKVREKAPWIIRQQLDFLSYYPITPPRQFVNGETHLYLGRQFRLRIEASSKNEVKLLNGRLYILVKDNAIPEKLLANWYREKAEVHFKDTLMKILPRFMKYGISKPELVIRHMPTRWGSCTVKGRVILNPELIKAPKGCIEYVVIHELCHLIQHNHNRAFYELQETIMPDWKKWKNRLENTLT